MDQKSKFGWIEIFKKQINQKWIYKYLFIIFIYYIYLLIWYQSKNQFKRMERKGNNFNADYKNSFHRFCEKFYNLHKRKNSSASTKTFVFFALKDTRGKIFEF